MADCLFRNPDSKESARQRRLPFYSSSATSASVRGRKPKEAVVFFAPSCVSLAAFTPSLPQRALDGARACAYERGRMDGWMEGAVSNCLGGREGGGGRW